MQLLFDKSYEFEETKGLQFIDGKVLKFNKINTKNTHIGWNRFKIEDKNYILILKSLKIDIFILSIHIMLNPL